MKNSITAAIAILTIACTNSFGAAILWSIGSGGIKSFTVGEGGTITETTSNISNGTKVYFYLGSTTTDDVKSAFGSEGFSTSGITGATFLEEGSTKTGGKAAGSTPVTNAGISSSTANDFFAVVVTSLVNEGKQTYYFKLLEGSQKGYETTGDPLPPTSTMAWTSTQAKASSWNAVAAAVPEPGTAALALLGIGMLIKRRRA